MNYFTQARVLFTVIIILVALNVTVLALVWGFWRTSLEGEMVPPPPPPPPPPSIQAVMAFDLKLTKEQQSYFKEASSRFMRRSGKILRQYYHDKRMMFDLLSEQDPDSTYIIQLTDTIGMQQARLERITIAYFMELRRACTPKQRTRFPGIFRQMLRRMAMPEPVPSEQLIQRRPPDKRRAKRLKRSN
ncbi:MAG: periplasmic heavy metal sensor [Bacteroidetes bacterium]|nr:periplasmic heavy metal sensor [Bacteroidota bacterium]